LCFCCGQLFDCQAGTPLPFIALVYFQLVVLCEREVERTCLIELNIDTGFISEVARKRSVEIAALAEEIKKIVS